MYVCISTEARKSVEIPIYWNFELEGYIGLYTDGATNKTWNTCIKRMKTYTFDCLARAASYL